MHQSRPSASAPTLELCLSSGFQPLAIFRASDARLFCQALRNAWSEVRHAQNQQLAALPAEYPIRRQQLREQFAAITQLELWVFCPERHNWFNVGEPQSELLYSHCPFAYKDQSADQEFLWQRALSAFRALNHPLVPEKTRRSRPQLTVVA